MSYEQALGRPPRCSLVNVHSGESMECLFNPTQLTEKVKVNWTRLSVPGLSHQVLQYQNTENRQLGGVEFYLNRLFAVQQPGAPEIMEFRAFLRALTVPPEEAQGVSMGAPPRCLVIWPGVITVETVLTELEFQYKRIGVEGKVLVYTARCELEEILDVRVTSEQLRKEV